MTEHVCNWASAWPSGHPLPEEDPARLTGPEVGEFVMYQPDPLVTYVHVDGERVKQVEEREPVVVKVLHRSYVWSPGECRSKGGYRHYDWSVIEEGPDGYRRVVVDDKKLSPLPVDRWSGKPPKVRLAYAIRS